MLSLNYTEEMLQLKYNGKYRISKYEFQQDFVPDYHILKITFRTYSNNHWQYPEDIQIEMALHFGNIVDPILLWEAILHEIQKFDPLPTDGNNILKDLCSK